MSRRRKPGREEAAEPRGARKDAAALRGARESPAARRGAGEDASAPRGADEHRGRWGRLPVQLALLTALFGLTVAIAELAGAANLGVSLGIGQIAFTVVLVLLLSRG
jgi:hypothetical protein